MSPQHPKHERKCPTCGAVMLWIPLTDVFGRLYRWRAWCDVHGHATREANR